MMKIMMMMIVDSQLVVLNSTAAVSSYHLRSKRYEDVAYMLRGNTSDVLRGCYYDETAPMKFRLIRCGPTCMSIYLSLIVCPSVRHKSVLSRYGRTD